MPRNGSGTFSLYTPGNPVVPDTDIEADWANNTLNDIASGLTNSLSKDGQTTPTGNIQMGNFKFTSLGAGSARSDSSNLGQVQDQVITLLNTVSGTDTLTASLTPAITTYASGQMFKLVPVNNNTGAVTIDISSVGVKSIYKGDSSELIAGDLIAGREYLIVYDGTQFQLLNTSYTRDLSAYSGSDISLSVGDTVYYDVSGVTSIPLNIATLDDQQYEIQWHTSTYGTGTTQSISLQINNTTYASSVGFNSLYGTSTGTTATQSFTTNAFFLGISSVGRCVSMNAKISTTTTAKTCIGNFIGFTSTTNFFGNFFNFSTDTTTAWTSLGTVSFGADSMTGRLIVRRVL